MKNKNTLSGMRLTLRSSGKKTLPPLLDSFLQRIDPAVSNERHHELLHALRLRGKRLRYAMEMYMPAYKRPFKNCLDSVKEILSTLGRIHDLDVNLPILKQYIRQVGHFNSRIKNRSLKIHTMGLRRFIHRLEEERHEKYLLLCKQLLQWKQGDFRQHFITSIR